MAFTVSGINVRITRPMEPRNGTTTDPMGDFLAADFSPTDFNT